MTGKLWNNILIQYYNNIIADEEYFWKQYFWMQYYNNYYYSWWHKIVKTIFQEVFGPKQDLSAPGNGYLVHSLTAVLNELRKTSSHLTRA